MNLTEIDINSAQRIYERNLAERQAQLRDERSVFDFDAEENPHHGHRMDQVTFSAVVVMVCAALALAVALVTVAFSFFRP